MRVHESRTGQAMVLGIVFLSIGVILLLGLFRLSLAVRDKIRLQLSADLALKSALNVEANGLNAIALANRAMLSDDALSAQVNALVSETTFYRRLLDGFCRIIRFIPGGGLAFSAALGRGGKAMEALARKGARILIPAARIHRTIIGSEQRMIRASLPFVSLKAAGKSVSENFPGALIPSISQALLLRQARSVSSSMAPPPGTDTTRIIRSTLNSHTLRRNWRIGFGAISLPIKKRGGGSVLPNDFTAFDKLKVRTFRRFHWTWKTVLSTASRSSRFGYRSHGRTLNISDGKFTPGLTLLMESRPPRFSEGLSGYENKLYAVSSGEIYYERPGKPDEAPNLFNPFWRSRLIPVSEETTAHRLIPRPLLKEVRH